MTTWKRVKRLAVAGQAEIYLVRGESGEFAVMKKMFKTAQLADPEAELRRFEREVRCQSAMEHPGIMPILGYDFNVEPPFYLMPRAEKSLDDEIADHPRGMAVDEAAEVILDVCAAVEYAHQQGILHRDLKPANILLVDGAWVVADFGLCRDLNSDSTTFTRSNTAIGTIAYMAPEQFDDAHDLSASADVHALGKMFYHMLTGRVPFPYVPLEHLPGEFRYAISKAIAENPNDRYATVSEFARQIELLTGHSDILTPPSEQGGRLLAAALAGDRDATGYLLELVLANTNDEVFLSQFVARLPKPMLAAFQALSPPAFADLIRAYDQHSEGGHPFNYVDIIADFFANVFAVSTDPLLREVALRRIMLVGESHNRFYVGEVFARIIGGLKDPQDVLLATSVMRSNGEVAAWYRSYLNQYSLPRQVRNVLDGVA